MERQFLVDGEQFSLKQILHDNTHPDAEGISIRDIESLITAKVGDSFYVGMVVVERIS